MNKWTLEDGTKIDRFWFWRLGISFRFAPSRGIWIGISDFPYLRFKFKLKYDRGIELGLIGVWF